MSFTPRRQIRHARSLRGADTPAEARLWTNLRGREARLIVEVDGATHSQDQEIAYDRRRTVYLKAQGFRIVRVMNDDVYRRFDDVMDMILLALEGKIPEA